jgi:peptide-methionine (S)-S-oxide reductase
MFKSRVLYVAPVVALLSLGCVGKSLTAAGKALVLPDPTVDEPAAMAMMAMSKSQPTAVFAGGCFWGVDAVFKHVRGVTRVTSGYAGGAASTAQYEVVSTGRTGHAETVEVVYDRSQISYGQLLKIFFSVAHDPTELNRQGPDTGPQYRSVVFFTSDEQQRIGRAYIDQLNAAKVFPRPIVTEVVPLKGFYRAEDYHQNYLAQHPDQPYIRMFDQPKLENLRVQFPDRYVSQGTK